MPEKLIEREDYYINQEDNLVFTEKYHLKRGYCCQSGCLHCPYGLGKQAVELRKRKAEDKQMKKHSG